MNRRTQNQLSQLKYPTKRRNETQQCKMGMAEWGEAIRMIVIEHLTSIIEIWQMTARMTGTRKDQNNNYTLLTTCSCSSAWARLTIKRTVKALSNILMKQTGRMRSSDGASVEGFLRIVISFSPWKFRSKMAVLASHVTYDAPFRFACHSLGGSTMSIITTRGHCRIMITWPL